MISAAESNAGSGSGPLPLLLLAGLAALMYFMVLRPQSQRRKKMQSMQESVSVGSPVLTIGGLYGTVVSVDDESVSLEVSPGVTNRYARGAIAKILEKEDSAISAPADASAEVSDPADDDRKS